MKITKFVHSCVLIEHEDKAVLIDPGIFSWQSGLVAVESLPKLDTVVVTHMHPDHMGEPFIKALVGVQPDVEWLAPADAHEALRGYGAINVSDQSTADIDVTTVDHAKVVPFGTACKDLIVSCFGLVTDPGDTHDFSSTNDILLLPVQAPWGTTIRAIELGMELKPKYIVPIHDWMWNEDWRNNVYQRMEAIFADTSTTFLQPVDGRPLEINL